ncbi:hypothetical protein ACF3MZ_19765 [Paenibacillaceae bacterium WGS1546]|uniref:hypothetical protein n=1 Tax=Cohnella sp. WGS1546 TaxID=3366810 RepID=UPI00372D04DF
MKLYLLGVTSPNYHNEGEETEWISSVMLEYRRNKAINLRKWAVSAMEKMETYNRYVEQEDDYYRQLETLESCQSAIFDHIYRYGGQFDELTAEEVLLNLHQLEDKVRLDLLQLKLAKAFLAYRMKLAT